MRNKFIVMLVAVFLAASVTAQELPLVNGLLVVEFGHYSGDRLSMPTDVAVSSDGRVYVVDSARNRVKIFDAAGNPLGSLGSEGDGEGQLSGPVGIDIARNGDVYVADKNNNRLQVFKADGSFRRSLPVEEAGVAAEPVDVAVSAKGKTLYVTTNDTHKVLAFSSRGKFVNAWGGQGEEPGQFNYPATIDVDDSDKIYVVDVLNARVRVFKKEGEWAAQFGKYGAKPGSFIRPKGIAADSVGRIYVSDSYLGVVQVFDAEGSFIGVLGVDGEAVRFEAPTGLAIRGGRLYVTDMLAGKVLAFDVEGAQ
jgi:DNA-binding beta-propeller fold protein YncE